MTMPPDHELDVRRVHAHDGPAAVSVMPTSEVIPSKPQPPEAWRTVDGILKGTTPDTGQLPHLVAWTDALLAKSPVKDLVNPDHPAVSKEYARAGVPLGRSRARVRRDPRHGERGGG